MSKVKERVVSGNTYGFHIATTVAMLAYFNFDLWIGFGYAYATFLAVSTIGMFLIVSVFNIELKNARSSPILITTPRKIKLVGEAFDALMKKTNYYIFVILLTEVLMGFIAFRQQEYFLAGAYIVQCIGYVLMIDIVRRVYKIWDEQGFIVVINWAYDRLRSGAMELPLDEVLTFTEESAKKIEEVLAERSEDG